MADKYRSFSELAEQEGESVDFRIVVQPIADSDTAIIAPHGGKIEPLTSELTRAIAGDDYSFYAFEGIKPTSNYRCLHITSENFNEPIALDLLASCGRVVAVHGLAGDAPSVQVGGRDEVLGARINAALKAASFDSSIVRTGHYGGMSENNICNRGRSGAGVQLEIKAGLRNLMREDRERFDAFVTCVRSAISAA